MEQAGEIKEKEACDVFMDNSLKASMSPRILHKDQEMEKKSLIPVECIEQAILLIRSQKIMLDADLAALYEVQTKQLVRAVKRNISRFPIDFMFQLTEDEFENLRCQIGTSSQWGGRRYPPYAFTEQGVRIIGSREEV